MSITSSEQIRVWDSFPRVFEIMWIASTEKFRVFDSLLRVCEITRIASSKKKKSLRDYEDYFL